MSKKELAHIAGVMYELQEYCGYVWDELNEIPCHKCPAGSKGGCNLFVACHGIPKMWDITKADIERLERESNDD